LTQRLLNAHHTAMRFLKSTSTSLCVLALISAGCTLPSKQGDKPPAKQAAVTANTPSQTQAAKQAYLELGPLLGHIGPSEAKIWAKASGPSTLAVRVGQKEDLSDGRDISGLKVGEETFYSSHLLVDKLEPSQRYYYCVLVNGKPGMSLPYPSFETAPKPGEKGRVRFAFVSCVGYNGFDSAPTWAEMATRTNFDLLLMLGDNHYGDTTDPKKHLEKFTVQRKLAAYAEISRKVPQYAIWDNHDYSPEPCDKTAKNKEDTLRAFQMLWPNPVYGEPDNPGVYHKFSRGQIDFFMTDGRYYRDPNKAPDDGHKSMLGKKQLAWLKKELLASKAPVKVIGSGGEFESNGILNSWTSFKSEREELFKFIDENKITGVLLLSGDRHFTAAYQVQGKWIEVSSGPTGSKNSESKPTPEMFYYSGKGKYFCIYDIDTRTGEPSVVLEIYRTGDGLVERRKFSWDEVLGLAKISPLSATQGKATSGEKKSNSAR
jgi:alkaline phosphatase D